VIEAGMFALRCRQLPDLAGVVDAAFEAAGLLLAADLEPASAIHRDLEMSVS
jgi:hypothetical protein